MLATLDHHPHAKAVLGAALEDEPAHAYLLHGPAGSGKREAARAFAGELLARDARDPGNVRTRAQHGSHPDLTWVTPSGAHEMLVGDIEEAVVAAAAMTPFESSRRVFVIERADTLIEQAANKLLKTLEEPASFVHLVLLTDRLGGTTLLAGTTEFGGIEFEVTQPMLDALFALTYAEKNDPGMPAVNPAEPVPAEEAAPTAVTEPPAKP